MKRIIQLTVWMLPLLYLTSCSKNDTKEEKTQETTSTPQQTTNNQILGVARIEPEDGVMKLTSGTTGKITAVLMDENQHIQKGQALMSVEVAIENAQLNQSLSKMGTQKAAIESARASMASLQVSLKNAQETYDRNLRLFEGKALTKEVLDNSKASLDKYAKDVVTAEANLAQTKARINELDADITYYRTVVNQKKVAAPVSGKVLNVLVKTGEYVTNTTEIAEIAPAGSLIARTEVDELYADKVAVGQKATILSQTTGKQLAEGMVSFTGDYLKQKSLFKDQSTEQEDRRVREVHIKLTSGKMPLIGSRVDCMIQL